MMASWWIVAFLSNVHILDHDAFMRKAYLDVYMYMYTLF